MHTLLCSIRNIINKNHLKNIRKIGKIPGNIYSKKKILNIIIDNNIINNLLKIKNLYNNIIKIIINNINIYVLIKKIDIHAYKNIIFHINFQIIYKNKYIKLFIPIKFINYNICNIIKSSLGYINFIKKKILIKCLPFNIPKYFLLNLLKLNNKKYIYINDIILPNNIILISNINTLILSSYIKS